MNYIYLSMSRVFASFPARVGLYRKHFISNHFINIVPRSRGAIPENRALHGFLRGSFPARAGLYRIR